MHADVTALSRFQTTLLSAGFTAILARDLPTAMLAHHYFEVAIISPRIAEEGDGRALGGVVRQAFPSARIVVLAPEPSVPTY